MHDNDAWVMFAFLLSLVCFSIELALMTIEISGSMFYFEIQWEMLWMAILIAVPGSLVLTLLSRLLSRFLRKREARKYYI
jgi:hypothetical protein